MDTTTLFKISQGLYITGAVDTDQRLVGSVIDAVMIVEVSPAQIFISLNENSYTREVVSKTGQLSLSVLAVDCGVELIKRFGFQTSRTADKWTDTPHDLKKGLPILKNSVASYILKVISSKETAHHTVFHCDVIEIIPGTMDQPLTYAGYRDAMLSKKGE